MTSIPASRRARATTLMPRSWPSRPTLARTTRGGRGAVIGRREGDSVVVRVNRAGTFLLLMIAVFAASARASVLCETLRPGAAGRRNLLWHAGTPFAISLLPG